MPQRAPGLPASARTGFRNARLGLLTVWALAPPMQLRRVELLIDVANEASQRTAERAGYLREGVLHSYLEAKGRRWDVAIYARVA